MDLIEKLLRELFEFVTQRDKIEGGIAGFLLGLGFVTFLWRQRHRFGWRTKAEVDLDAASSKLNLKDEVISARDDLVTTLNKQLDELKTTSRGVEERSRALDAQLMAALRDSVSAQEQLRTAQEIRRALVQTEDELWTYHKSNRPSELQGFPDQRTKVLVVANQKGGVAKSTLSTCLAAYFSRVHEARVLMIDLDFQGSSSITMTRAADMDLTDSSVAMQVLSPGAEYERCVQMSRDLNAIMPGSRLITSGYEFARFENRLMLQWLFAEGGDDVRLRLCRFLASKAVTDRFEIVVIDTGPRLTTGAVCALAAAHFVLVPTVLDRLSVEATGNFLAQARRIFRDSSLNPSLEFLGAIKTLTTGIKAETDALASLNEAVARWGTGASVMEAALPRRAAFSDYAGTDNPYLRDARARGFIDPIGDEICARARLFQNRSKT